MSKLEFKELVPELRFSQTEWQKKPFNKIYTLKTTNSLSRDKLNYDDGLVKNIHYGDIHTKFSTLFDITKEYVPFINTEISLDKVKEESYCQEGDMIFADASEDIDDVGKSIELVNLNGERLLSGLHTILARPKKNDLVKGFGGYLFKSEVMRKQIQKESQGAKVLGISASRISNIEVIYPIDHDEQQKIADCLSSMDNLITVNNKKLDSLNLHKKGLMKKLFPAEGKSAPELRFAEFKENWEINKLGSLVYYENGKAHEQDIVDSGIYTVVNSKFISSNGKVKKYTNSGNLIASKDDILMVLSDVPNGRAIAKCFYVKKDNTYTVNQRVCKLSSKDVNSQFLFYLLNRNAYFLSFDDGVKQTNLKKDDVLNCPLFIPNSFKEQEKIASCLSSLDEFIYIQSQKIETLKEYKKGLMQKLFPEIKESIA
ncbi:restriction endonuclease subunit S [Vibrio parahaemolyticus]|nr:restriction endonuclease subunit S [Vibrio parahaemolyticus]EJB8535359.1 restriction endonuclease subunit S [Vibrio parahaemolyticus]ELB2952704.1 restriction endonuclease subunit S [Vibrio parahaemolyticus]MCR9723534.1 restriction endonuclease subunit S [Vibrio parahaemolyticus]MCR9746045.1 restriction endonuclease subunit S [Vibrio parahaemolyticus]MCZ6381586.1 restriction endonuclease subunit S [Vibrio parahaemolyticus]